MNQYALISADAELCIGCGICTSVCPFTVLIMQDGLPRLNPNKHCLQCLHCAAACPQHAIRYQGEPAVLPSVSKDPAASFSDLLCSHIKTRRSYRHFSRTPVARDLIKKALQLADFAPSAKNEHPVSWIVLNGRQDAEKAMELILSFVKENGVSPEILSEYEAGNNVVMGTAPTLIMGYTRSDALNPLQDTALALYAAELVLQSEGVGTCWAGYLTRLANASPDLRRFLGLPENCQFTGALMAGYPQEETYLAVPLRSKPAAIKWL